MSRTSKNIILSTCLLSLVPELASAKEPQGIPIPTQTQLNWQEAELAAIFHYDLHVFDGNRYNQKTTRVTPVQDHNIFNPSNLDTDQWVKAIKDAGFKIAILTATHETGFALYQSDVNPYSLKSVKWRDGKGDIVRDFVDSCHQHGIQPAIYIGIRWNSFFGVFDFKVQGDDEFSENRQEYYNRMCEGMVDELTSRYGKLAMIWFDGGAHGPEQGGPDVLPIFEKNQPDSLFYHNLDRADIRWGGSETGTVPYPCWGTFDHPSWSAHTGSSDNFMPIKHGDPDGNFYMPAMSDAPLRGHNGGHEWFWGPNAEKHIYPLESLMDMYYKSVGRNTTLIVGLTPDPQGLMPEPDVRRLREWGNEIKRRFSSPLAQASGTGNDITMTLDEPRPIDHIVLQEDISKGERVREFKLQAEIDGKWTDLYKGSSIGHKHIVPIDPVIASKIRFVALSSIAEPQLKSMSVFKTDLP